MLSSMKIKKLMIWTRAMFMKKKLRQRYRRLALTLLTHQFVEAQKWGVSYSVFDNEEMLEHSIKCIRDHVDYVNVVYQLESWYGNPASETLLPTLNALKEKGLINELIEYKADPSIKAGRQERNKRNMGLERAKKAGVSYFMTMDCDEFYIGSEVEKAKEFIIRRHITHSIINIFNYFTPTLLSLEQPQGYVHFFSRITKRSKLVRNNKHLIALTDQTRILSHYSGSRYFFLQSIAMHHMTMYRKDIAKKVQNTSSPEYFKSIKQPKNCVQVEDLFHLEGIFDD